MGNRLATIDMGQKEGDGCAPLGEGELGPQHNVAMAQAYLHAKFHLHLSNHLATVHQHHRQTDNGPVG